MKALVVVCNYDPDSLNHAIAKVSKETLEKQGYDVFYHDLYEERFDPVLSKEEYEKQSLNMLDDSYVVQCCLELKEADMIVIVHPDWWGQPPALLKGWIDRIFRRGISYQYTEQGKPIGLLQAEKAVVINTSNTPEEAEVSIYGDPLQNLWETCIFHMCGVKNVVRLPFREVIKSDEDTRKAWLLQVAESLTLE